MSENLNMISYYRIWNLKNTLFQIWGQYKTRNALYTTRLIECFTIHFDN